jgi:hypothetical protein
MTDESTVRAIRGLTIAIWALVVVFALGATVPLVWSLLSFRSNSLGVRSNGSAHSPAASINDDPYGDIYQGFENWPIEKQIASASAIVLTKYNISGDELTSTVSEILKVKPGTALYYKVGDEYAPGSRTTENNVSYGDGEVIFFTGSPAQMRLSTSYSGGRCRGIGDMSIETLKKIIASSGGS